MGTKVKDTGGGDFKKVPQGTHAAVCNMVVDLGPQVSTWQGQDRIVHQVYVRWEIPGERLEYEIDGVKKEGPLTIGKTYTASLSEKANLRKDLEGWRNKAFTQDELNGFDIETVLGKCCQVIVTHRESNGNIYANVTGVAGWPKGLDPKVAENEAIYYGPDNQGAFEKLPKWIKEKLNKVPIVEDVPEDDDFDDSIPF